jgi:hypothetical protein
VAAPPGQTIYQTADDGVGPEGAAVPVGTGRAVRATSVVVVGAAVVPAKTCVVHHFMINQFAEVRKNIDIRVN